MNLEPTNVANPVTCSEVKENNVMISRRSLMTVAAGLVATAGLAYWQRNALVRALLTRRDNGKSPTLAPQADAASCELFPEQTAGPYYISSPVRSDIREDRSGLPLELEIELVELPTCTPIADATVEIWHCDASGGYSGHGNELARSAFDLMGTVPRSEDGFGTIPPSEPSRYLRGALRSGVDGKVRFQSVFPGWYEPRACHIHVKVTKDEQSFLTTQLYFADELCSEIYGSHPDYVPHGLCPYNLRNDLVLRDLEAGSGVVLAAEKLKDRVTASVRAGVGVGSA